MPPLKPAQVKIRISPFSFAIIGLSRFNGNDTAINLASTATITQIILKLRILSSADNTITSKPMRTNNAAFNISSIKEAVV